MPSARLRLVRPNPNENRADHTAANAIAPRMSKEFASMATMLKAFAHGSTSSWNRQSLIHGRTVSASAVVLGGHSPRPPSLPRSRRRAGRHG